MFTAIDICNTTVRINQILATEIFERQNHSNPFVRSAFIELLVGLRHLMYMTEKFGSRISFTDDVIITPAVKDIADLIRLVRNAVCHPELTHHWLVPNQVKATFTIAYGKVGQLILMQGVNCPTSDYTDDVAFMFGLHRIYLRRHIVRAFEQAKDQLRHLLPPPYNKLGDQIFY